ncbi:MAG: heme exporter protein CcmD [Euryhalocaulis sp.]|uniref:hypothetical protein n=1 Tax=Euryhalocaulis sp. TaxID=2744307 RepID=UPI0017CA20A0|nr:hypothetical protein [Euryhalocaulis sp.]MBA4802888.1 heme exporter protein CcmD [Euryhalocaulis sp.]
MSFLDFGPNGGFVWAGWLISAAGLIGVAVLVLLEARNARKLEETRKTNARD